MSRRSRGCLRCRQRRVKCDEARPSCLRCLNRSEVCVGYRDESDLIFQHETKKTTERVQSEAGFTLSDLSLNNSPSSQVSSSNGSGRSTGGKVRRSRSLEKTSSSSTPSLQWSLPTSVPESTQLRGTTKSVTSSMPWLKQPPEEDARDVAAHSFMDRYVLYPCTETSAPGFLEHLPSMFNEINIPGRFALRYAVQAAGAADLSRRHPPQAERLADEALKCYGKALGALGSSLGQGQEADDYDLMTVVVLDLFEARYLRRDELMSLWTLFLPYNPGLNSHAEGMAHILRLRGHKQFSDPRGWSLFRLAHHRIQKQQLAKQMAPLAESEAWFERLDTTQPHIKLEKSAHRISQLCQEARQIMASLQASKVSRDDLARHIRKMYELDAEAARWREDDPQWSFRTLRRYELKGDAKARSLLPSVVELHPDIWMSYEWNYHRTARILLHQQMLQCVGALDPVPMRGDGPEQSHLSREDEEAHSQALAWKEASMRLTHKLADEIFSTVPQSFGDIDRLGRCVRGDPPLSQAIGAYFLLWPCHVIRGNNSHATEDQKREADRLFERIRECTGMRSRLGSLSDVRRF